MKIKPITDYQLKYHARNSAKYILVEDRDGNAYCQKCDNNVVIKAKHLEDVKCPCCGEKVTVQHKWRMSKYLSVIKFMAVAKALDKNRIMLRFVLYDFYDGKEYVGEAARMIIDERKAEPEYWCYDANKDVWEKTKNPYFRKDSYMMPNRFCCYYADPYMRTLFREANKLDCFKYYPVQNMYESDRMVTQLLYDVRAARINEKLYKAGFEKLADYHVQYFVNHGDRCYPINRKQTSLHGMLKISKQNLKCLKEHQDSDVLRLMQTDKNFDMDFYNKVGSVYRYKEILSVANTIEKSKESVLNYIGKNKTDIYEYEHYLNTAKKVGHDITDSYYSMPSNFRKADNKVTAEYKEILNKEAIERNKPKDILIKKISDGLRNMPGIEEFVGGNNGLLVYVPESVEDLVKEGEAMHNCIGTYADRIVAGKTLVFYIRQLSNPTAPFVAMEYCNGEVVQIRYDHNEAVDERDDEQSKKVVEFAKRFASVLRENKVLVA